MLRAQPELVLERLAETRSVWSAADVEREVRSTLGVRSGHEALVQRATEAAVGASLSLDPDAYTLERVVVEERAVFEAAATLAGRHREVTLRAPDAGLDAQQQAAYAHLGDEHDLSIVTGICGRRKVAFAARHRGGVRGSRVSDDRCGGCRRCSPHAGRRSGQRCTHRREASRGPREWARSARRA